MGQEGVQVDTLKPSSPTPSPTPVNPEVTQNNPVTQIQPDSTANISKKTLAIGGTATAIYFVRENTTVYRHLRDQVRLRYDETLDIVADPRLTPLSVQDLEEIRDQRNKWKESSYIALILVQALGGVDAFVDAHMHGYKINEDLTMKIKPTMESASAVGPVVGLGISFNFY